VTRRELTDAQGRLAEARQQLAAPPAGGTTPDAGALPGTAPIPTAPPQP
jgi:hypothetical protein